MRGAGDAAVGCRWSRVVGDVVPFAAVPSDFHAFVDISVLVACTHRLAAHWSAEECSRIVVRSQSEREKRDSTGEKKKTAVGDARWVGADKND